MDADPRRPEPTKPATPRWVKVFAVIGVIAVAVILIMLLSGGEHGPGRHLGMVSAPALAGGTSRA